MAKKPWYWNDDTKSLSLSGCSGHSEGDITEGEIVPKWYEDEYPENFEKFCQNQQISSKKNVTFSEKQTASLVNSGKTVDKLRLRIVDQTAKIKVLEKKVDDYEVSFPEFDDLGAYKEEIQQLKAEIKELKKPGGEK